MLFKGLERRALTDWKDEAPPPHIERKAARGGYHNDSNNEPDNGEAPQDEADHDPNDIEYVACISHMR